MARVELRFETTEAIDPQFGNFPLTVIRLMTNVCFRRPDGSSSEAFEAVVDTGAFVSVLPKYIWREIGREIKVADASFGGISERRQCQIKCSIGTVTCFLTDEWGNRSHDYNIVAFLAKTDKVPLIIGFADLLEHIQSCFHYETGEAWVQD
jgi:hypothetical protein